MGTAARLAAACSASAVAGEMNSAAAHRSSPRAPEEYTYESSVDALAQGAAGTARRGMMRRDDAPGSRVRSTLSRSFDHVAAAGGRSEKRVDRDRGLAHIA